MQSDDPADRVRDFVARWRGARGDELLQPAPRLGAIASEFTPKVASVLEAIDPQGLEEGEAAATRGQLARLILDEELAPLRASLRGLQSVEVRPSDGVALELGAFLPTFLEGHSAGRRALVSALSRALAPSPDIADAKFAAYEKAAKVYGSEPHPDAGPRDLLEAARSVLDETSELSSEARAIVSNVAEAQPPRAASDLFAALATAGQRFRKPREGRFRRIAEALDGLGVARDLRDRVRVERAHREWHPRNRVVPRAVPTKIHIRPSSLELGFLSELAAAEGLGQALGYALTHPGIPSPFRFSLSASVPRTIGALLALLFSDREFLRASQGMDRASSEVGARLAAATAVLELRWSAAAFLGLSGDDGSAEARLSEALGFAVPASFVPYLVRAPAALGPRFRGRLVALRLAHGLRERFDADWYRNPRSEQELRAASARGGAHPAEAWAGDLAASQAEGIRRLSELVEHGR
ncbi:MAG: hypothetical protein AAGF12_05620 [Myxococcota bacterium]